MSFLFSSADKELGTVRIEDVEKQVSKEQTTAAKNNLPPTLHDIPKLTKEMVQGEPDDATEAAKRLYELCDVAHKHNREPMVATGKYDVLNPLAQCLLHNNEKKLHFVCLTLNNLSIPHDNKKVMTLERVSKKLIGNLCQVIAAGKKEAYLCIICLMNLSYYEPAEVAIGQFSPKPKLRGPKLSPLENPNSLLRILQDLTAHAARGTADFRWAFGLLAILAKHPDNALLIGLTAIPKVAMENITLSKIKPSEWKNNSLEDFSLFLLLHLADTSNQGLDGALEVVSPIMHQDTGVQGLKASMICALLEAPWSEFPNYGVIAAGCISELMSNTFERSGKKGTYANNVFSLKTAVKAYGCLAKAAAKADSESTKTTPDKEESEKDTTTSSSNDEKSNGEDKATDTTNNKDDDADVKKSEENASTTMTTNTKVVALPTAVAQLFQIIAEISSRGVDDDSETEWDNPYLDLKAGEIALAAISAVLPALLQAESPPRQSLHTEAACLELSQLLVSFSKRSLSARTRATDTSQQIWAASKSALPLLEASYDLWKNAMNT